MHEHITNDTGHVLTLSARYASHFVQQSCACSQSKSHTVDFLESLLTCIHLVEIAVIALALVLDVDSHVKIDDVPVFDRTTIRNSVADHLSKRSRYNTRHDMRFRDGCLVQLCQCVRAVQSLREQ